MDARPTPKPGILEISPYVPGKAKAQGFANPVKLSSNENPLGCSPKAREAYLTAAERLHLYPDPRATILREAVAAKYGLDPDRLLFGVGSDEIFGLICQTFCQPGDNVVQPEFGFFAYRIAGRAAGAEVRFAPQKDLRVDVDCLLAEVDERTRVVLLDNPGNPTGSWITGEDVRRLHAALPSNVLLLLDSAYAEFVSDPAYEDGLALAREAENVITTRTFSKIHGLAGDRIGWATGAPHLVDALNRIRGPFNITIAGQAAAIAALEDAEFVRISREHNLAERTRFAAAMAALGNHGLRPLPSEANFVLLLFEGALSAEAAIAGLAERGYAVRHLPGQGLPQGLRITIGTAAQMDDIAAALRGMAEDAR